jgi:dienelactone hydrolase
MAFRSRRAGREGTESTTAARLDEAAVLYPRAVSTGRLFEAPATPRPSENRVQGLPDGEVVDLAWTSAYRPVHPAHEARLRDARENQTVHVRWLRHRAKAPAVICLHGWGTGMFPLEERAFLARWLFGLGADVLLAVLPFHARRRKARSGLRPIFPSADPVLANEGFAQAVSDLRGLLRFLKDRGAEAVSVTGMSLGGFTTALLATVEPAIDAAIPIIPFASLPGLLWEHGDGTEARDRAERAGVTFERFQAAFTATSPLARRPVLRPQQICIVAGERDRITPLVHANRLREHFGEGSDQPVELVTFEGAHLLQAGRGRALAAVARFLAARRLIPRFP